MANNWMQMCLVPSYAELEWRVVQEEHKAAVLVIIRERHDLVYVERWR
jgi:hypothetical protein